MVLAVKCSSIIKTYESKAGTVQALRGVSLEIQSGELFMIVGPSGCGKTTLISIIAGILDQTKGECKVLGRDAINMSSSAKLSFRSKNIGFVFQQFNLLPTLTAAENVAVPLLIQGVSFSEAVKKANKTLELVGLGDRGRSMPSQLSGGQQQRVAIARSIIHKPQIIVCDEPTSALDHHTGEVIMDLMKNIAKTTGCTLIIVTHDNRIYKYADRIAEMDDGVVKQIKLNNKKAEI